MEWWSNWNEDEHPTSNYRASAELKVSGDAIKERRFEIDHFVNSDFKSLHSNFKG